MYSVVSCDSHVDMSWLPGDLFVKNAPSGMKDRMPHIRETPEGMRWVAEGRTLGVANSAGFTFIPPVKGSWRRIDRMLEAGFYDGRPHPTDPALRLACMKQDNIDAEILYGITGTPLALKDRELIASVYRIYNDWVDNFCGSYPGRWYALACLPVHDPIAAAAELRRVAGLRYIRGAELMANAVSRPIYSRDGHWDPLWAAAAEAGMPLSFHNAGPGLEVQPPPDQGTTEWVLEGREFTQNELAYRGISSTLGQISGAKWLCSILLSGACERYPAFRFVLGEAGAGWIPFILGRLDHAYEAQRLDQKLDPPLAHPPSFYWYRQGATTFQDEPLVGRIAHLVGTDNVMWGSDFPHPDSVWPDSHEAIKNSLGELDPQIRRKIVCDNAVALYRMGK